MGVACMNHQLNQAESTGYQCSQDFTSVENSKDHQQFQLSETEIQTFYSYLIKHWVDECVSSCKASVEKGQLQRWLDPTAGGQPWQPETYKPTFSRLTSETPAPSPKSYVESCKCTTGPQVETVNNRGAHILSLKGGRMLPNKVITLAQTVRARKCSTPRIPSVALQRLTEQTAFPGVSTIETPRNSPPRD